MPPFLVISGHDYRSKRRATVHFMSRELARTGMTKFFSVGYSPLSLIKGDPRASLWSESNRVATSGGLECYLWKTPWHPLNLRTKALARFEAALFRLYALSSPPILHEWILASNTIILESGMSILFFEKIKQINPRAKLIYLTSDSLVTTGCSDFLVKTLSRVAADFDSVWLPSPQLAGLFPPGVKLAIIPHGMDATVDSAMPPESYRDRINMISIGSMLFDPGFFEIAAAAFPDITFHILGGGRKANRLRATNIIVQGETAFEETLRYIQHADAGIAAYQGDKVAAYLADTSMKLLQFGAYGLPSVCPHLAVGDHPGRFGYTPGDRTSIVAAVQAALQCGRFVGPSPPAWAEVTRRILGAEAGAKPAPRVTAPCLPM